MTDEMRLGVGDIYNSEISSILQAMSLRSGHSVMTYSVRLVNVALVLSAQNWFSECRMRGFLDGWCSCRYLLTYITYKSLTTPFPES